MRWGLKAVAREKIYSGRLVSINQRTYQYLTKYFSLTTAGARLSQRTSLKSIAFWC